MEPTGTPILAPIPPKEKSEGISFGSVIFSLVTTAAILFFTHRPRIPLLIGFAVFLGMSLCPLPIYVIVGKWRKLAIGHLGIFLGGKILRFQIAGLDVRINGIPMGGYVQFLQKPESDTDDLIPPGLRTYDDLGMWERILHSLAPLMVLLLVAMLLRGPQAACASFLHTFEQTFAALCSPVRVAPRLIRYYFHLSRSAPLSVLLGIAAAKIAAYNLIPVAGSNGNAILEAIFRPLGRKAPSALRRTYRIVVGVATAAWLLVVGVAIWVFLFGKAAGAT